MGERGSFHFVSEHTHQRGSILHHLTDRSSTSPHLLSGAKGLAERPTHHHYVAFQVAPISGVHLICIYIFTHIDLSSLRLAERLIDEAVCGTEAKLNNGLSLLLHLRLPPTVTSHHTGMVDPSSIHPHGVI
jgi:hypothetical protein